VDKTAGVFCGVSRGGEDELIDYVGRSVSGRHQGYFGKWGTGAANVFSDGRNRNLDRCLSKFWRRGVGHVQVQNRGPY